MSVGQSGLGKSTLVNTLFKSKVSRKSCTPNYEEKISKTVKLHSISHSESTHPQPTPTTPPTHTHTQVHSTDTHTEEVYYDSWDCEECGFVHLRLYRRQYFSECPHNYRKAGVVCDFNYTLNITYNTKWTKQKLVCFQSCVSVLSVFLFLQQCITVAGASARRLWLTNLIGEGSHILLSNHFFFHVLCHEQVSQHGQWLLLKSHFLVYTGVLYLFLDNSEIS